MASEEGGPGERLFIIDVPYRSWDRFEVKAASFADAMTQIIHARELPMTPAGDSPYEYEGARDVTDEVDAERGRPL